MGDEQIVMRGRIPHLLSWGTGILALLIVVWYFQPSAFFAQLQRVGFEGSFAWLFLTFCTRVVLAETTVLPVRALGFSLRRSDAFWLGWIRAFANQIVPLSGLVVYTREIRRKAKIPWSVIVAFTAPMFLFATAALSAIGLVAIASNAAVVGASTVPMLITFALVGSGSILAATQSAWVVDRLPIAANLFAEQSATAFRRLSEDSSMILALVVLHALAILLRGTRIWLLFVLVGVEMSLPAALLIIVIAESAALFQLTPGGLGLREGAIIGGAILLHISPELGVVVALIDRLFIVATTTFLAIPGFMLIRR